jgi:hypothetical protein
MYNFMNYHLQKWLNLQLQAWPKQHLNAKHPSEVAVRFKLNVSAIHLIVVQGLGHVDSQKSCRHNISYTDAL